jgi:maltooligosyltrehalose trehalohydrolase
VGNRALGERIGELASPQALRAFTAVLLLAPAPPLRFMGQELMAASPFLFFCDFGEDLARSVTEGRRREFAHFERFSDSMARESIPDPNDPETFLRSKIDWGALSQTPHANWYQLHRDLLAVRRREIAPRLSGMRGGAGFEHMGERCFRVSWRLGDSSRLTLAANLGDTEHSIVPFFGNVSGTSLYLEPDSAGKALDEGRLPPWLAAWYLKGAETAP